MQPDQHQQSDAHGPKEFHVGLEKVAVAIDRLRPEKDLQIAHQMSDNEQKGERRLRLTYFLPSDDLKGFALLLIRN